MGGNDEITPETWEKLFAVLPKSKVSNLRCVAVCSSRILECPVMVPGDGSCRTVYFNSNGFFFLCSVAVCELGDKAGSLLNTCRLHLDSSQSVQEPTAAQRLRDGGHAMGILPHST